MMRSDTYYFDIIRQNIKKHREAAGLTQQQLADKSGITMNYLAKIESQKMQRGCTIVIVGRIGVLVVLVLHGIGLIVIHACSLL